jgi:DNA gyrase subunit B
VKILGKTSKIENGTQTTFKYDAEIFKGYGLSFDNLTQRFREMAFVTRGVT